jgi:TIGR03009 family protein
MPTPFSSRPVQGAPQVPQAPFKMTPQEQDYVNRVLAAWEKYSDNIKTFEAEFTLRTYGDPFQNTQRDPKTGQQQPVPRLGTLKYEKPDKGYFEVAGDRPKKWICDGTSLYEYSFVKKELVQHVLPPEERGQAILNGPLPFIFGAKAATLKQRYWIRALPSPSRDQIWLQAFPKYGIDASNFCRAEMIVSAKDMHPIGIQMLQPNRKTQESYAFSNIVVNKKKSFVDNLVGRNGPFYPELPRGWTKLVKQPETAQSNPIRTTKR